MTKNRFVISATTLLICASYTQSTFAQIQPAPERKAAPAWPPTTVLRPPSGMTTIVPGKGADAIDLSTLRIQVPTITRPGVNVTNWGIVERRGSKTHGKIGETLFVEGRDLDPNRLIVEARVGNNAARFNRKPGGTSSRVEFTIPSQAVSGDMMVTLQAVDNGNTVLSSAYGICEQPKITRVSSPLIYSEQDRIGDLEFLMTGKVLTLEGECLDELDLLDARRDMSGSISVGSGGPKLLIKRIMSQAYAKVELELHSFDRGGSFEQRFEGAMRLSVPKIGPNLVLNTVREQVVAPPQPEQLMPMSIQSVESNTRWGSNKFPFVVVSWLDNGSPSGMSNPFRADTQIKINGQNLIANRGTTWSIGSVALTAPNVNSMITLPPNAVSGQVCAVRSDGVRSCAPQSTAVVASPRIMTAPAGWPLFGTFDERDILDVGIRRSITLTGFDLKPPSGLGLEAVVEISNFDRATNAACDLDLQVHRFDAGTLVFSFGTPGGARPDTCTEEQEANLAFLTRPGATADLKLKWIYQGNPEAARGFRWRVRGVR
jgi:hypothetical protein